MATHIHRDRRYALPRIRRWVKRRAHTKDFGAPMRVGYRHWRRLPGRSLRPQSFAAPAKPLTHTLPLTDRAALFADRRATLRRRRIQLTSLPGANSFQLIPGLLGHSPLPGPCLDQMIVRAECW